MSRISTLTARTIQDSRGDDTIQVTLTLDNGTSVEASVPQGKSTGSHEAVSLPALDAVRAVEEIIAPRLVGHDSDDQKGIDALLVELGGSQKKETGANATLAVSIAVARAAATAAGVPLWQHVRALFETDTVRVGNTFPRPFINVINGGAHAKNNLPFQEYWVIPQTQTLHDALALGTTIFEKVGTLLSQKFGEVPRGDEGGFSPTCQDPLEPFVLLEEALGRDRELVLFGLDAAATNNGLSDATNTSWYERMITEHDIRYIEDPYGEESFDVFGQLLTRHEALTVIGDDLTTTNTLRMRTAEENKSVNGVIIKPNQIGTVSETLDAVRLARTYGWQVIVSHRSGETEDTFIADCAYGVGADGIKIGAPFQPERHEKYKRLSAIEHEAHKE